MITTKSINCKFILFYLSLIAILFPIPTAYALKDGIYEEYCFSGLVYSIGEGQAEKLKVQSVEEFLNKSELIKVYDTPLHTLQLANQQGKKEIMVYVYKDVIESPENVDMLFYYTDVYDENYRLFGCAITSNNISTKKIFYDTVNAVGSILWDDPTSMYINIFQGSTSNDVIMESEMLVINDLDLVRFNRYFDRSSMDSSIRWHGNLTLLVPYVEGLPGKKAWNNYVRFRNADALTPVDRETLKLIKENKTTYVEMPSIERIKPEQEDINYVLISQMFAAFLILMLFFYLIVNIKRERDSWLGEDE